MYNGEGIKCGNTVNCFYDSIKIFANPSASFALSLTKDDTYLFKGQFIYKYNAKEMKLKVVQNLLLNWQVPLTT